jgi:hypothetical protein
VSKAREINYSDLLFQYQAIGGTKTFANFTANFQDRFTEDLMEVDKCKTNADVKQVESNGLFSNHAN